MGAPRGRSRRTGTWVLAIAGTVTVLMSAAAVYLWMSPDGFPGAGVAVAPASGAPVPVIDAQAVARDLIAAAPELTEASAEMLVAEVPSGGGTALAEMALLLASRGFDLMERAELVELGQLFEEAYAALPPADHAWMGEYMRMLREGSLDAEGSARGRRLLTDAVSRLPDDRRQRLRALLEKAIRAGIAARHQAEERTQAAMAALPAGTSPAAPDAAPATVPLAPAPEATPAVRASAPPPGGGTAQTGRGEAYWRSRMREARARVERLQAEIAKLEKEADRGATGPGYEPQCMPPSVITRESQAQYEACLKAKQNWPTRQAAQQGQRLERLAQLREQLAAAERAIGEVEDEARRDGALPGWLRE